MPGWKQWMGSWISSVQSLSRVQLFATSWTAAHKASLSITNSRSLLKLMPFESVMPFNHLILCHCFLLPPSIFSWIRVVSNESVLHIRWPNYWSFSFNITPSNEYSGLISFRMDWLDLLAVPLLFAMKWWDQMPWSSFSECRILSQFFHSPLSLSSRGSLVLPCFCHKDGIICISVVIDISPSNLDSSLCFLQPSILHDVLCI